MVKKKSTEYDKKQEEASNATIAAVTLVNDRFNKARNYRRNEVDAIWQRSYDNWRGKLDSSKFPWRSKLFIPWSFTVVETIIPKVFARDPKWRAISRDPSPQEVEQEGLEEEIQGIKSSTPAQASVVGNLLTYQWSRADMRIKMYDYIKDSLMYSKGFAKVTWRYKRKTTTTMEPIVNDDDSISFEKKVNSQVEYDDPQIDIVDPYDLYIDPDATSAGYGGNAKYIVHRKTVPLEELKDNPNYKNVAKITEKSTADPYEDKFSRFDATPDQDSTKNLVEILEYWEQDRLIVIANKKVVLRDTPNPYAHKQIPFVELDDYRDPHKLYGQSELSVIDPLQREINSIRNQRRDYDNLALNPVIQMVPGTLRNPNSASMRPGSVWMVSDLNSIGTFQLPQLQGSAVQVEQQTAGDIQMAVAIDEIGIGLLPEGGRRSATEVVTATSMAGKRFAVKIALLEEAVKKIGQLVFALNQQFLDKERLIQIVGQRGAQEWLKLGPEDIRGEFFIDIETGSMLPKDEIAARQEAVQLLQYITPIISPVIQTNPAVILPVIRMVLDTFELPGKQEILDELNDALGQAKEQQQAQAQAQQAATEADTINSIAQASGQGDSIATPETLQGLRADNELEQALG